jgi:hypothetical protein
MTLATSFILILTISKLIRQILLIYSSGASLHFVGPNLYVRFIEFTFSMYLIAASKDAL